MSVGISLQHITTYTFDAFYSFQRESLERMLVRVIMGEGRSTRSVVENLYVEIYRVKITVFISRRTRASACNH